MKVFVNKETKAVSAPDCRTLVVTGASSGVGEALVRRLAGQGRRVYAVARSAEKLRRLEKEVPDCIVAVPLDVTDAAAVRTVIERIESERPIDALVNNAAIYQRTPFAEQALRKVDEIIDTNVKGTLYPTHAVLPAMIRRKRGRIVMVNSVAGTRGIVNEAVYCAGKHAIIGFSDALMQELIPHNIQVAVLNPGGIDTPLWNRDGNSYPGDKTKLLKPEEVAEMVQFVLDAPDRTLFKRMVFFPTGEWH
jgi:3-oxoacyl-[acyl-carrier protein] reductase